MYWTFFPNVSWEFIFGLIVQIFLDNQYMALRYNKKVYSTSHICIDRFIEKKTITLENHEKSEPFQGDFFSKNTFQHEIEMIFLNVGKYLIQQQTKEI